MKFQLPESWHPATVLELQSRLLAWFDTARRALPWRQDRDPYRIWVSEVMLQQTTVAAVQRHFPEFMKAFATVEALASAEEQQVLHAWQGLGYYRRARHLHQAARRLVESHGGQLPDDPTVWAELPGVGEYILGAVLSQAFDRRLPIVEANSMRVLSRWLGYRHDPRSGAGKKWIWQAARALLPESRCGDYNQALMELGAMMCTPVAPSCTGCPARTVCLAFRLGLQAEIPVPKTATAVTQVREVAVIIRRADRVLFARRPTDARWADLWEFPHGEVHPGESIDDAAMRIARELTGVPIRVQGELLTVRHTVTRYRIEMTAIEAMSEAEEIRSRFYTEWKWLKPGELNSYPTSSPQKKLIEAIARPTRSLRLF